MLANIHLTQLFILSLLTILSYLLVSLMRRYAERRQIIDHPNERSSHVTPNPRGGGLAIVGIARLGRCVTLMFI